MPTSAISSNTIAAALVCTLCTMLPASSALGVGAAALSINNDGTPHSHNGRGRSIRKSALKQSKSAADTMALKIGLNVVPKRDKTLITTTDDGDSRAKRNGHQDNDNDRIGARKRKRKRKNNKHEVKAKVPSIIWGKNVKDFFWGNEDKNEGKIKQPSELNSHHQQNVQLVENEQEFPLYLLRNVLPPSSLELVLSFAMDHNTIHDAEEMEQHGLVHGKPRALRRSLVKRLEYNEHKNTSQSNHGANTEKDASREILDMVVSGLPPNLVRKDMMQPSPNPNNKQHHPYEDGSIVYYRSAEHDFYDAHHDSYFPGEEVRERQRAYTILLYLRAPSGSPRTGGTEFPRLTPLTKPISTVTDPMMMGRGVGDDGDGTNILNKHKLGLVVKPRAGDALVWPNFDREGNPYMDSIHSALPLEPRRNNNISKSDDGVGKIVMNLWFEG